MSAQRGDSFPRDAATESILRLRDDFPALQQTIDGKRLAFLDSAASAQCPEHVIQAVAEQRRYHHANVHRGVYQLAEEATARYEAARSKVARFIGARVFRLRADYRTPAHELEDGIDFVPTNRYVLWGHHFTSVAGAAPIVGPAIAVIWGWAPAFLWVTLGTVFFAGVHDFGALWASVRNKGQSMGMLSGSYIGRRGRNLFLVVIFLLLLMVNAAFAVVIANLLVSTPTSVIPVWGAILVALVIGQLIYRWKVGLLWPSIGGVIVLYALILIGNSYPLVLPDSVFGMSAKSAWIVLLFLYAGIACLRGAGDSFRPMRAMILVNLVNINLLDKTAEVIKIRNATDAAKNLVLDPGNGLPKKEIVFEHPVILHTNAINEELDTFFRCINSEQASSVGIDDAIRTLEVAFMIEEKLGT